MTAELVSRFVATTLLASAVAACSSGTDDPYVPTSTAVAPATTGGAVSPATISPATSGTGTTSTAPAASLVGGSIDPSKRFGTPVMTGSGLSDAQYATDDVTRDGKNYFYMSNGWGPGWESYVTEWDGTSFTVLSMQGEQGPNYEPAGYPAVFCGKYSRVSKECGLPKELSTITALRTGWTWSPAEAGSNEQYNAAYDVWLGSSASAFSGYFMVWLREPRGQQPAGESDQFDIEVANVPGLWDIWVGEVNKHPIINYVRAQGADTLSLEFDIMDFIRDAQMRGYEIPGTWVHSVAVGFEIWNGPITNLKSHDFYLDVQ